MKTPLIVILSIHSFQKSFGQDSIKVVRQYNYAGPTTYVDSFFYHIANTIFISLDEGFDDSLYITVNDTIVLNQHLKSNESIGYAGGFGIHFTDSSDIKTLKLKFVNADFYIEEKVNLTFKSLQIGGGKPWRLYYSNKFPMRE